MQFDFGQPMDGLIQVSFVVEDLELAVKEYETRFGVRGWRVVRDLKSPSARYRGQPSTAAMHLAMAFSGHMQYELIQPADDNPSVHREVVLDRGYGFHHFGYATTEFDSRVEAMHAQGYETAFSDTTPGGIRVAYFDTRDALPGFTELIEASGEVDRRFSAMYRDSLLAAAAAAAAPEPAR